MDSTCRWSWSRSAVRRYARQRRAAHTPRWRSLRSIRTLRIARPPAPFLRRSGVHPGRRPRWPPRRAALPWPAPRRHQLHGEDGEHPRVIQHRLGHATARLSMELYAHVPEATDRDVASHLDSRFRAADRLRQRGSDGTERGIGLHPRRAKGRPNRPKVSARTNEQGVVVHRRTHNHDISETSDGSRHLPVAPLTRDETRTGSLVRRQVSYW